jgi:8-hydroxy-5-deazaflavin:NADPH oxidoreductase
MGRAVSMKVGILGTGVVGRTLGTGLIGCGHQVLMGGRTSPHDGADAWAAEAGEGASAGTFADAAQFGDLVVNATAGVHSVEVFADVANPLDFSAGFPPRLSVLGDDSLAEQIQRTVPRARVVKALNTVTASVMVAPHSLPEPTDLMIAGDDVDAKAEVLALLADLGWPAERVRDLGHLAMARGSEMYLMLWLSLMGEIGSPEFNVRIVAADQDS